MHTTRCFATAWWTLLALGAMNLAAQEGAPPTMPTGPAAGAGMQAMPPGAMPYGSPYGDAGYGGYDQYGPGGDGGGGMYGEEFVEERSRGLLFGSADALMWWSKGIRTPPLVTTSPTGTPFAQAGVIAPGNDTTVLMGGNNLFGTDMRLGGRGMLGTWLNDERSIGVAGRFTMVDSLHRSANFGSVNGDPILAVPFFDVTPPPGNDAPNSIPIAFPLGVEGIAREGAIRVASSQQFMMAEAFNRVMMVESQSARVDLIGGYHFARIDSGFELQTDSLIVADPFFAPGTRFAGVDRFKAENEFHGMELGLISDIRRGRWAFSTLAKVSYGAMIERMRISGGSTVSFNGSPPVSSVGNIFTGPTNIGNYTRTMGVISPELNMNLTYHIAPRLSLSGGYSFIWFNKIASAGDAINPNIDLSVFPPPVNPTFHFKDNDFWVMGGNLGLNWDF